MVQFLRKIFNPAVEEINFDSFIKFPVSLFGLLFFDFTPLSESASFTETMKHHFKSSFYKFCLFTYATGVASMLAFAFLSAEDFLAATAIVPNFVSLSLIGFKGLITLMFRKNIWIVCQELREMDENRRGGNVKYKVKEYLDSYHGIVKVYAGIFMFLLVPVASPIFSFLAYGEMTLTVAYWFPFDAFVPKNYLYAYVFMNFISGSCLMILLAGDSMLYALITFVAMEFDILKADFTNFDQIADSERQKQIKIFMERHNKLLKVGEHLQSIYGTTFLFCFGISSLVMCFVAFQLSQTSDFTVYAFYVPYLGMVVGQILLLCVFGQKIFDSSEAVSEGVYNSGWENFSDTSLKKQMILIILRAQRPKRLTAMKFADISHASFTTVS